MNGVARGAGLLRISLFQKRKIRAIFLEGIHEYDVA